METAEEARSLPGHPTVLPGRAWEVPSAAVILVEHRRGLSPSSENPFLGRSFHLGDIFYTLSSWDFNTKDPLLDQGAKAKTVSGHRANSGQQETGRGQFFSHVVPSLPQEALSLYSAHMLWVKDQESPTQSLHPCLWHHLRHPPPNIPASQSLPRHRQKNVSVNQITLKEEDAGSLHPARGI